jgi:hypothetical protein
MSFEDRYPGGVDRDARYAPWRSEALRLDRLERDARERSPRTASLYDSIQSLQARIVELPGGVCDSRVKELGAWAIRAWDAWSSWHELPADVEALIAGRLMEIVRSLPCTACGSADVTFGPPEDPFVLCGTCGHHQARTGARS